MIYPCKKDNAEILTVLVLYIIWAMMAIRNSLFLFSRFLRFREKGSPFYNIKHFLLAVCFHNLRPFRLCKPRGGPGQGQRQFARAGIHACFTRGSGGTAFFPLLTGQTGCRKGKNLPDLAAELPEIVAIRVAGTGSAAAPADKGIRAAEIAVIGRHDDQSHAAAALKVLKMRERSFRSASSPASSLRVICPRSISRSRSGRPTHG